MIGYDAGITGHVRLEFPFFKQALYNGRLSDSDDELRHKIALAVKHNPGTDLAFSTYESDGSSPQ